MTTIGHSLQEADILGRSTSEAILILYVKTWLTGQRPIVARCSERIWKQVLAELIRTKRPGVDVELDDSVPDAGPCVIVLDWAGGPFKIRPDSQLGDLSIVIEVK